MAAADDEFQYVRLPDGTVGRYPKGVPDSEIADAIDKQFPQAAGTSMRPAETFGEKLRKVAGYTPMAERKLGRPAEDPSAIQRLGALTTPIEGYTEQGRAEHPILSRIGDVTRGLKDYGRLIEPLLPLMVGKGAEEGPPSGGRRRLSQPPPPRPPNYTGEISGLMTPDEPAPQRGLPPAAAHEELPRVEMPYRAERPEVMERGEPAPETLPTTRKAEEVVPPAPFAAPEEGQPLTPPTAEGALDAIARKLYGRPYAVLSHEEQVNVARQLGEGGPGGIERRVTQGESTLMEQRAGRMPLPTAGRGALSATPTPSTPSIARPGQPPAEPAPSQTLPRTTRGLPQAPPPTTLGGEPVPPASLDEILRRATGQSEPPQRGIPLNEQLRTQGAPVTEAPPDPLKKEFPDPKLRQYARANGAELVRAAGDRPEVLIQVHGLSNVEVREAAINSGIDVGTKHVGSRMNLGPDQVSRQDLIDQMIREKNVKPEDIPGLAKPQTNQIAAADLKIGDTFVDEKGEPRRIVEITKDGKIKTADGTLATYKGGIQIQGELNSPRAQLARGGRVHPEGEKEEERPKPGPLKAMVSDEEATQHTAEKLVRPNDGLPVNEGARVFEKDGVKYYTGSLTPDQYIDAWENMMSHEEIEQWRPWYSILGDLFKENFGTGPQTPRRLTAWLASQRNTPPARGMQNVFRVEDVLAGQPKIKGALGEDVMRDLLQGKMPSGGMGPKLHDFVDSAFGRETRTWMGDRPQGGRPAVIDVHSARGTGYYDDTLINWIKKEFGEEAAEGLVRDLGSGKSGNPNPTQYERGSEKYNALADELNRRNYHDGGWTPLQVQAVDWARMGKMLGRDMDLPQAIFDKNMRRIAFEANFHPDSYLAKLFPSLSDLPMNQSLAISREVGEAALKIAKKEGGGYVTHSIYAPGGWLDSLHRELGTQLSASAGAQVLGSPESADRIGNLLGHLLGQQEILVDRPLYSGDQHVFEIREVGSKKLADPANVQKYWNKFTEHFPGAEGFSPVRDPDGVVGIRMLNLDGHWTPEEIAQMKIATDEANAAVGIKETDVAQGGAEAHRIVNVWADNPKGEQHLQNLREIGRPGVERRIRNEYVPQIVKAYRSAFQKNAPDALKAFLKGKPRE